MDCTWNTPGLNAYQGSDAAAVARYGYPRDVQDRLAARAKRFDFDFLIEIKRDSVVGNGSAWLLADMHYGRRDVCKGGVSRAKWPSPVQAARPAIWRETRRPCTHRAGRSACRPAAMRCRCRPRCRA